MSDLLKCKRALVFVKTLNQRCLQTSSFYLMRIIPQIEGRPMRTAIIKTTRQRYDLKITYQQKYQSKQIKIKHKLTKLSLQHSKRKTWNQSLMTLGNK